MSLLVAEGLSAGYDRGQVLHNITFEVAEGEITVVLGANGAGKTTLLRALTGLIRRSGHLELDGVDLMGLSTEKIAARGVAHVPQGRGTFIDLTVEENLRIGAHLRPRGEKREIARWYEHFPRLGERRTQKAGGLSGGEQQMLAIARALMSSPRLLLLDEPSLGLAPKVTQELFASLGVINAESGATIVVVEQNAHLALDIGSSAVLLEAGRVVSSGPADVLKANDDIRRAYLGG
ncbi:ABC transporter ATP-binding protein [Aeromicrobium sp.]|uniref:ABC transporter ATP-binding protein n=1 Tax=Aeromicrobium sp. TaxID=1871063 RepID=UPI0019C1196C|nr:ABC transporter ATP-binding protein [Aeromicrobium sp.]MBC7630711.1 ABC transporter ATP-binding protein [Aeromicrobium sp.]